jgi:4-hydroxy-tetrahydrodipicolinate reductase
MPSPLRVSVTGATGKMAREIIAAVARDPELELVSVVSRSATGGPISLSDGRVVPACPTLEAALERSQPEVVIDFTHATATLPFARAALPRGVSMVIGTTGLPQEHIAEIEALSKQHRVGCVLAPNFALSAVLLMYLARLAAPYFDHVEVIELHHDQKRDAPSGTALATALQMAQARGRPFVLPVTEKETVPGTRGGAVEGVAIHSVRLPGLVAHQEVVFGAQGQTLTLRQDSTSRESFLPGILLAVKQVRSLDRLVVGLEPLLGLPVS